MTVLATAAIVTSLLLTAALVLGWRLHTAATARTDEALRMVEAERARTMAHQAALRRYEVTFASVTGRGELGEQALIETVRALGLREGLHFSLQTAVAGAGSVRPDLLLTVGGGRRVPVDAKATLACWAEAMETDDPNERADALRAHARHIRARARELAGKGYERWADGVYGTVMFVPSDAAVTAALDADPTLLRWLLDQRVFLCGPTSFAVIASAALFAATESALSEDVERIRATAVNAHRSAVAAVKEANVSGTHLTNFLAARRRELEALDAFRGAVTPLTHSAGSPTPVPELREQPDPGMVLSPGGEG